jgi:peroxiredoxin
MLLASCAFAAGELSNRRAPSFALFEMSGKQHDILDYRGKVLILDFMQVSCPHCATFSRVLEKVKAKYGDKVAVLSIVNPPSDKPGITKYIEDNRLTSPVLWDCSQVSYSYLLPKTPTVSVPHVFLVDAQGTIRYDVGYSDVTKAIFEGSVIFAEIDKLLATPPAKKP